MPAEIPIPEELIDFQENITSLGASVENEPKYRPKNPLPRSEQIVTSKELSVESIVDMPSEYWGRYSLSPDMEQRLNEFEVIQIIDLDSPVVLYETFKKEVQPNNAEHALEIYKNWMSSENQSLAREMDRSNASKRFVAHKYMMRHAVGIKRILEWIETLDEEERTIAATDILVNASMRWLVDTQIINQESPYEAWPSGAKVGYARVVGAVAHVLDKKMQSFDDVEALNKFQENVSENLPSLDDYHHSFEAVLYGCQCEAVMKKFIEEKLNFAVETSDSRDDALNGFDLTVKRGDTSFYLDVKTSGYLDVIAVGQGENGIPFTFKDSAETVDLESCNTPRSLIEFAQRGNMCASVRVPVNKFMKDQEMHDHLEAKLKHIFEVLEANKEKNEYRR